MNEESMFFAPYGANDEAYNYYHHHHQHHEYYDFGDEPPSSMWQRLLQYKPDKVRIDYSVLSVAVMTLGLIMIVEVFRHRLDHAAAHRPFSKAVLEGVNSELATLGIVEFFLHILAEYKPDYDKAKKHVFADVHFLLFYTAILNALQSLLLSFVSGRVSQRMWVETEMLELNHYVEIREEFQRVKLQLDQLHHRNNTSSSDCDQEVGPKNIDTDDIDVEAESSDCLSGMLQSVMDRIRYPALKAKYNQLLLQIRFHELRVHFLQAYNLPAKFRVSDYLMRSEQAVLMKLIHVSTIAWLLLTGVINLCYYILGIVSYKVQDTEIVGTAMIWLFFSAITLFVLLSLLVYKRMKSIFSCIMHTETLWDVHDTSTEQRDKLAKEQRNLFWGGDPKIVIAAIQSMQFGYAVAVSTVIVFWDEISDGSVQNWFYLLAIFLCYTMFVVVTGQVIPEYTLCTSLGQLVDVRRLHETLADYHLQEAQLKEQQHQDDEGFVFDQNLLVDEASYANADQTSSSTISQSIRSKHQQGGSVSSNSSVSSSQKGRKLAKPGPISRMDSTGAQLMLELVKKPDTESLRESLPEHERRRLAERTKTKNRLKQVSDGVIAMNRLKQLTVSAKDDFDVKPSSMQNQGDSDGLGPLGVVPRRNRAGRRKAQSEGVALMAGGLKSTEASGYEVRLREDPAVKPANGRAEPLADDAKKERDSSSVLTMSSVITPSLAPKDEDDDNASVGSDSSGYSDFNDVPEVDPKQARAQLAEEAPQISLRDRLYAYFMSRRYVVISNVFGTMIAFFYVGQRVESFLHSEAIASDKFTHFDFAHDYIFWLLTAWLGMFLIGSGLVVYTLRSFSQIQTNKERQSLVAAIIDILLTGACLTLFFVAEAQRCCVQENGERFLADEDAKTDYDAYDGDGGTSVDYYGEPAPCTCPTFGSRQYGGLGMIEPWVSLIALRSFRHWLAKRIVLYIDSKNGWSKKDNRGILRNESLRMDPFDMFSSQRPGHHHGARGGGDGHGGHHDHGGHGHGAEETGTAAELWEKAMGQNPDIVAQYGEFSGEMLRAMLGLSVEPRAQAKPKTTMAGAKKDAQTGKTHVYQRSKSFRLDEQYAELSPAAQQVIMAGKLGKSVVKTHDTHIAANTTTADVDSQSISSLVPRHPSQKVIFELDENAPKNPDSMFFSPNARLVRSMRRCDRKLLPILDKWSPMDVVMTRYEMVYFDAVGVDDVTLDRRAEGARQALVATKGGKGLRLCDVAAGRRVVGRLLFSEISSIHVERNIPGEEGPIEDGPDVELSKTEFWKQSPGRSHAGDMTRGQEWLGIKQDRVRIHTVHGHTLYLRFYADLDDAEAHAPRLAAEDENAGFLFKNNAFQWVQTIGRFCGLAQLGKKQHLPHFGDNSSEELRDYLVVVNNSEHSQTWFGLKVFERTEV